MSITPPMSPMDGNVDRLKEALCIILDANSDPIQRKAASEYCDGFKTHEQSIEIALCLLQPSNDLSVRNFALLLLDSQRNRVFGRELWMSLPRLMLPSEQRLIKEKLAKIIADAAIREWPEQWSDFAGLLQASMGEELSILILTRVVQVLYGEEEFIRVDRKGRLRALFEETLLLSSLQFLAQTVPASVQNRTILDCFEAFISWAPFPSDHLIGIERQLLMWREVEVLESISSAAAGKADVPPHIAFLYSDEAFGIYNALLSSSVNNPEQYDFLKAFVNWFCTLGNNFITKIKTGRETYLSLMLALTRLPPLMLRSTVCMFWIGYTRIDAMIPTVPVNELFLSIIEMECRESFEASAYNDMDFDDKQDYKQVQLATRGRLADVFAHLAKHEQAFRSLISISSSFLSQSQDQLARPVASPSFVRQWTLLCHFIENTFRGYQKGKDALELLQGMLSIRLADPVCLLPWIAMIRKGVLAIEVTDFALLQSVYSQLLDILFIDPKLEPGRTTYDTTNTTDKAIEAVLKLSSTLNAASITPLLSMIMQRTSQYFASPLCATRRSDRRRLMELVLSLSVSQKDLCDVRVLRSMADSVCSELKSGIASLSSQSLCSSDAIRASLTDTLSLIVIAQKHLGKHEEWESFARTVIEQLSSVSFTDQKLQEWVDDSLHLAWMCLTNLTLIRTIVEKHLKSYPMRLKSMLIKDFLRPLATARGFDPMIVPLIKSFLTPVLLEIPLTVSSMNEDVELARLACNLRSHLTSFIHDLLCLDQACLDGSGQAHQCNDYTLELLHVKNQNLPTRLFIPQLAPGELVKRVISEHDLTSCMLQSFLDSLTALQNPLFAATVTTGTCSKVIQTLVHYLPAMFTGELLPQTVSLDYIYNRLLQVILNSLSNPSLAELQAQFIALLTEIIKWSWMLGLDRHLPPSMHSDILKERLLTPHDLSLPSIKTQRKTVRRLLIDGDSSSMTPQAPARNSKSMLAKLKAFVENGQVAETPSTATDEPLAIDSLFNQ